MESNVAINGGELLPDAGITFEQLGKVADWHPGYVVWEAPAFVWLMERGGNIHKLSPTSGLTQG